MKKVMSILEKLLLPIGVRIGTNKYMLALRDGFVYTLPFTLTGSVFLLIAAFPLPIVNDFITGHGIDKYLYLVSGVTFDLIAVLAVLGISYHLAKSNDDDAFVASVLSLIIFFLLQANFVISETGEIVTNVLPKQFLGTGGVFTAIFIALIVPTMFHYLVKKDLTIKMPEQVPPAIARSFASVLPVMIIITVFWVFQVFVVMNIEAGTISDVIYHTLQVPLQAVGDTFMGVTVVILITQLLWFFGIHGATVVMGVVSPIYQANSLENLELLKNGMLSLDNGAHLVTMNLFDSFINNGGSGMTLGIVLLMLNTKLFKSKRNNELAKLAVVPGVFTINEPVLFGLPIILNPMLLIPFVLTPLVTAFITLGAIQIGFMPPFNGIILPWTTPPIISGFIICGFRGVIVQVINICVTAMIWYPFFKILDKTYYLEEQGEVDYGL